MILSLMSTNKKSIWSTFPRLVNTHGESENPLLFTELPWCNPVSPACQERERERETKARATSVCKHYNVCELTAREIDTWQGDKSICICFFFIISLFVFKSLMFPTRQNALYDDVLKAGLSVRFRTIHSLVLLDLLLKFEPGLFYLCVKQFNHTFSSMFKHWITPTAL